MMPIHSDVSTLCRGPYGLGNSPRREPSSPLFKRAGVIDVFGQGSGPSRNHRGDLCGTGVDGDKGCTDFAKNLRNSPRIQKYCCANTAGASSFSSPPTIPLRCHSQMDYRTPGRCTGQTRRARLVGAAPNPFRPSARGQGQIVPTRSLSPRAPYLKPRSSADSKTTAVIAGPQNPIHHRERGYRFIPAVRSASDRIRIPLIGRVTWSTRYSPLKSGH